MLDVGIMFFHWIFYYPDGCISNQGVVHYAELKVKYVVIST